MSAMAIFGAAVGVRCSCAVKGPQTKPDNEAKWVTYRVVYPKEQKRISSNKTYYRPSSIFDPTYDEIYQEIYDLCEKGELDKALAVLSCAHPHSLFPSNGIYWILFRTCAKVKGLTQAKIVYQHLLDHGCEIHPSLQNFYVGTLIRCGDLQTARRLFRDLSFKTSHSWTAVITGLIDCGKWHEAMQVYELMLGQGLEPNEFTFASLIKACGNELDFERAKELHAQVKKHGFTSNAYVASALISMYGKCGSIVDAEDAFYEVYKQHNAITWTSMMSAYVDIGHCEKALLLYRQMLKYLFDLDERISSVLLQACCLLVEKKSRMEHAFKKLSSDLVGPETMESGEFRNSASSIGIAVHADIRRKGLEANPYVCNSLVTFYSKSGNTKQAENFFVSYPQRDVISWNGMLTSYIEQDDPIKALHLYYQMHEEGIRPNERTFVCALQACSSMGTIKPERKCILLEIGRALHEDVKRLGLIRDAFVGSVILGMYGKHGRMVEAEDVFDELPKGYAVSWNVMLSAYVDHGLADKALQLFAQMKSEGVHLVVVTLILVLKACLQAKNVETCREIHFMAIFAGHESRLLMATNLISTYAACGSMVDACAVFEAHNWHNVLPWNALIAGYAQEGDSYACMNRYKDMLELGIKPDATTLALLYSTGCGDEAIVTSSQSLKDSCCQ